MPALVTYAIRKTVKAAEPQFLGILGVGHIGSNIMADAVVYRFAIAITGTKRKLERVDSDGASAYRQTMKGALCPES